MEDHETMEDTDIMDQEPQLPEEVVEDPPTEDIIEEELPEAVQEEEPSDNVPEEDVIEEEQPDDIPENNVPENNVPENNVPENNVPENNVPENNVPEEEPSEEVVVPFPTHAGQQDYNHPGDIMKRYYMDGHNMSIETLSEKSGIPVAMLENIIAGSQPIDPTIAYGLSKAFGTTVAFWQNLQRNFENGRW